MMLGFQFGNPEALYEVEVKGLPAIVAIAHGENIFSGR